MVDALLTEQREHSINPSEGGRLPGVGEVESWTTTFADFTTSIERLLDRLSQRSRTLGTRNRNRRGP